MSFDVDEWGRLSEFREGHTTAGYGRRYVHVHGSIGRPQSIVLCKEDYDARYVHETRAKAFLRELLTGHRVVFVGFGLNDEDLKFILREVAGSLGLSDPRHFALLPRPDSPDGERIERENLTGKYRVEPVYFDNSTGDFSAIVPLVSALAEDVNSERKRESERAGYLSTETVPELLDQLLQGQPEDLKELLKGRLPGILQQFTTPVEMHDADPGGLSHIDSRIDAIFKLVEKGLPDDAIREYEMVRATYASELTARQRYRIEANIGNALCTKGKTDAAADKYLQAVGHYRESRDTQAIEILAYFLKRETTEAVRLAESLCQRHPDFGRARSLWVQCQPDDADFGNVEAKVPEILRNDREVALALSDLARRTGDLASHERYARVAFAASHDWPDALATLGGAILLSERAVASFDIDRGLVPKHPERLTEAENLFTDAIKHTVATDPGGVLAGLYFNRSVARRLRGNESGAEADLREAFRRDSINPTILLAFAMECDTSADIAATVQALDACPSDLPERDQLLFVRAYTLRRRRNSGDLEQALAHVVELSGRLQTVTPPSIRGDVIRLGLQLLKELGRASEGRAFVAELPPEAVSACAIAVLHGRAEILAGNRDEAAAQARKAILLLDKEPDGFNRREVALLAQNCGLHREAVAAWESLLDANATGSDTVHLVRNALLSGEWKKVLEVCDRVRSSGCFRREHLEAEVEVLANSREETRALALLSEWLVRNPSDKRARLFLSFLALRHGELALAAFDEELLPSVADVTSAAEGSLLVYVLRRGPLPRRALDVAYDLYRRFPEEIAAHHTLLTCVFDPSATQLAIERPTVVGHDTAACIRRDGEPARWIYVESGADPSVTLDEYAPSHELIVATWGKRAGDRFEFQGHGYEVVAVANRILRRVHELMERFEENFPDRPLIRRLSVPADPPAEAPIEKKLGEMMTELRRQEQHRELLEAKYRGNQLPLTSFARLFGRPVFDTVRYMAFQPMLGVRADGGDARRWQAAMVWLRSSPALVIDSTVLAGAFVLGLLDDLPRFGLKLIVPRAVLNEIRELSLNAASPRAPRGVMGLHKGQLFFHEASPEELAREVEALEGVLRFVRAHCEVVGGEATLDLPTELRKDLEEMVGATATDAVALAKKRGSVLWTDDLGLQILASQPGLGVRSVWTQAVLSATRDAGRISGTEYSRFVGRLIERGYAFTRLSARDFTDLLRNTGWRTDTPLGAAVIRIARDVALLHADNRLITAAAFLLIWQECPKRERARDIIIQILESIGRERSGPLLAAFIYRGNRVPTFRRPELRPLKRMLRSWRSRDGQFKPNRS